MTAGTQHTVTSQLNIATEQAPDTEALLEAAMAKIQNLEIALETSRTIGMAVGIVMERLRLPPDQAFDVLRRISQQHHRKLRDLASDLVFCGAVEGFGI